MTEWTNSQANLRPDARILVQLYCNAITPEMVVVGVGGGWFYIALTTLPNYFAV